MLDAPGDHPPETSANRALALGHLFITGGVAAIMGMVVLVGLALFPGVSVWLTAALGAAVGWMWWAVAVPRWWRWALERGIDPYELQRKGEATQLLWPRDSLGERTELGDRWSEVEEYLDHPLVELREHLLSGGGGADFTSATAEPLWGVVVELGLSRGSATLVALDDGTCSLYLSSGGGVIGAGGHAEVREAVSGLIQAARHHHGAFSPVRDVSLPRPGERSVFLLVADTVLGLRDDEEAVAADPNAGPVYARAQQVLTALREVESRRIEHG